MKSAEDYSAKVIELMVDPYSEVGRDSFTECTGVLLPEPDFGVSWESLLSQAGINLQEQQNALEILQY